MDVIDRSILNRINKTMPLCARPFGEVADELHLLEQDVVERVRTLKETGIIRRIGGVIDPKKLGWTSTLCAAGIAEHRMAEYSALLAGIPEITHNYVRDGLPNCWFTIIAPDRNTIEQIIIEIEQTLDIKVLDLPARKVFKVRVAFDLD